MTTWNPSDIGGDVTLSNGNLTATKTGGIIFRSGRATTSATTGKKYFECVVNAVTTPANLAAVGVAESTASLSTYLGKTSESTGYYSDGTVYKNDILLTTLAAYGVGDTVGMAIDEDAGKGWFCDGTGSYGTGDPATGANPHFTFTAGTAYFPAFTVYHGTNLDSITANFDATGLSHAIPSGFSAWDVFVGEAGSGHFRSAYWGAKYWAAAYWGASDVAAAATTAALTYGAAPHTLDPARVRAKYEEIDAIERRIRAKEAAERETIKKIEQEKRTLAELEEKKRQTKTIAARRRKIEARIAQEEAELRAIRDMIAELIDQIEQTRAAVQMTDRRRRMVLLLAAAAT